MMLTLIFTLACEDVDPIVETIEHNRILTPLDLNVKVRNQITAEINWQVSPEAKSYVLEFSKDSLAFSDVVLTHTVQPEDVPVSISLEGEERYSVRLKALSASAAQSDSKWTAFSFKTSGENIFEPLTDAFYGKTWATLKWPAGSEVTHFMIMKGKNEERHNLTAGEISAGEATLTDLDFDTEYIVKLMNGESTKQRGRVSFKTLPEGETLTPDDDLKDKLENANEGDVFLLEGGTYNAYQGQIKIAKSIRLKGLSSEDKPEINVQFVIADVAFAEFIDLEMNGTYTSEEGEVTLDHAFQFDGSAAAIGNILISGCEVHAYLKSFISGSSGAFTVDEILIENAMIKDIECNGGDFIDFRKSYPALIDVSNSTFINCATKNNRDFFRLDGGNKGNAFDDGSHTPEIRVRNNTFYNVQNHADGGKRFFYVRWQNSAEIMVVEKNLFADCASNFSSSGDTDMPSFDKNNYFNAPGFLDSGKSAYDASGTHTEMDPGFADKDNGDLSMSNQTLIDNEVGDQRWR